MPEVLTVALKSGGSVTLSMSNDNLWTLPIMDQEFVLSIRNLMREYMEDGKEDQEEAI